MQPSNGNTAASIMEALLLVAERDGPTMFARIGVMRGLNRHVERVFKSNRKDHHGGGGTLARCRAPMIFWAVSSRRFSRKIDPK